MAAVDDFEFHWDFVPDLTNYNSMSRSYLSSHSPKTSKCPKFAPPLPQASSGSTMKPASLTMENSTQSGIPMYNIKPGIHMDMTVPPLYNHPIYRTQFELSQAPKYFGDADVFNPESPYYTYAIQTPAAEARAHKQAQLDAAGQGKKWYSDCYIPGKQSSKSGGPCAFSGVLALPPRPAKPMAPYEEVSKPIQTKTREPVESISDLDFTQPRTKLPAKPVTDGIHVKSDLQKKRELELAEKQARRDRAIAAKEAMKRAAMMGEHSPLTRSASEDSEMMPPPMKSASQLRAEHVHGQAREHVCSHRYEKKHVNDEELELETALQQAFDAEDTRDNAQTARQRRGPDPVAEKEFLSGVSNALKPTNIEIGKKNGSVKAQDKKKRTRKATTKSAIPEFDSVEVMSTVEERWAADSGVTRINHLGVEALEALEEAISKMNQNTITLVQVRHADGKLEGFLSGLAKGETHPDVMNLKTAILRCKEFLGKIPGIGWNECLGIEEVNSALMKYDPTRMVSAQFSESEGRVDIFIYGIAKKDVDAAAAEAKDKVAHATPPPKYKPSAGVVTAGLPTPPDSSTPASPNSVVASPSLAPTSLKRKYDKKGTEDAKRSKRKKTDHNADDEEYNVTDRHNTTSAKLPAKSNLSNLKKRKLLNDDSEDDIRPQRKKSRQSLTNEINTTTHSTNLQTVEQDDDDDDSSMTAIYNSLPKSRLDKATQVVRLQEQLAVLHATIAEACSTKGAGDDAVASSDVNGDDDAAVMRAASLGTRPKIRAVGAKRGGAAMAIDLTSGDDDDAIESGASSKAAKKTVGKGRKRSYGDDDDEDAFLPRQGKKRAKRA